MTKREFYVFANDVFATVDVEGIDEAKAFIAKEVAALDAKNEKAKERAAAKRAEGDAMRTVIESVLGNEPMTVNDIIAAIESEYPDVTPAKIVARVRKSIEDGVVSKETVKVEGRKLVGYVKA